ncbi:MAG TPA: beta-ketoacyl-[acyl-carrier-protein] synthase family protein [Verrucomicrobiae bacterium]
MRETEVVIAGCGAISAVGCGIEPLLDALQKNSSGLRPLEKFSSSRFQSNIAGAAPRNFDADNPAWFLATEALKQARDSAQNFLEQIPAERTGLVLSTTKANIEALERISKNRPCSETARRHLQANLLADDLAAAHGARGPVQTVSVACVSGLIAIQQGTKLIQRGEADAVLVVGLDCLSDFVVAGFTALKALDPLGCRPFDAARCGLSPGEAGAAIVLARQDFAPESKIKILGFGGSNDANHLTGPSRDGSGLAQAIRAALNSAKLSPGEIDFVHAHGTGTSYNDAMEALALKTIFGETCPPVSGAKGMLGHTLGAAGVIETICCVLAMQENFLPGTPRLTSAADETPASLVREPRPAARLKNALKLNTGFGGMNGALILSHE